MDFQPLNKKAMGCMYTATALSTIIVMGIITAVLYYFSLFSYTWIKTIYLIVLVFSILNVLISPFFRYQRYRYAMDEECIHIREGFLWREENIVPIERLHKISLEQGPIDRIFHLTKVLVTTAGGDVTIRFLEYDMAQHIADSLKHKINQIAQEEHYETDH